MKILIVNKYYYPTIGGVESVVKCHAKVLSASNDVTVLCASHVPTTHTSIEKHDNILVVRARTIAVKWSMPLSISLFIYLLKNAGRYDQIQLHEPFPIGTIFFFTFKKYCKKLVVYYHSDIVKQKSFIKIMEFLQLSNLKLAHKVLTSSPNLKYNSSVLSKLNRQVDVVPIWIENSENDYHLLRNKKSISPNFLYLGRNSYYKGIDLMISAYLEYKEQGGTGGLSLVGDDFSSVEGFEKIAVRDDCEIVNSQVSEIQKKSFLLNCDCLVFPSLHKSEAFGIVQLEALRMSTPVINSDLPTGVPWVSKHMETGLTIDVGSKQMLTEALFTMENDILRKGFADAARERYKNMFDKEKVVPYFLNVLGL